MVPFRKEMSQGLCMQYINTLPPILEKILQGLQGFTFFKFDHEIDKRSMS